MKVIGSTIRNKRQKLGISQRELAIDICTQATISLIENNGQCKNWDLLNKICARVGLSIEEVTDNYNYGDRGLAVTETYLFNCEFKLAQSELETLKKKRIETSKNIDRYDLCMGIIDLMQFEDPDEAIFIFNEIIRRDNFADAEHYIAWCFLGIGRAYLQKGFVDRANKFYETALAKINVVATKKQMQLESVIDVYNAIARSAVLSKNYSLVAKTSQMAIRLLGAKMSIYRLTQLLEYNCQANWLLKRPKRASKMALLAYWTRQLNDSTPQYK